MNSFNPPAEQLFHRYLKQVRQTMRRAGRSPEEIEVVLGAIDDQLNAELEALGTLASAEDAQAILASMAPPSDYGNPPTPYDGTEPPTPNPALHTLGGLSALVCLGTIVTATLVGVFGDLWGINTEEAGGGLLIMGLFAAGLAGFLSRQTPLGRFGLYASVSLVFLCLLLSQV